MMLGDISDFQLGENQIPSLLYPDVSVTVEKAVQNKGRRFGFYGVAGSSVKKDEQPDDENIDVGEEDLPPIHPDGDDKTAGDIVNEALDNIGD